jgi:hypothetical protein
MLSLCERMGRASLFTIRVVGFALALGVFATATYAQQTLHDLPAESNGVKSTIRLSRLTDASLFNLRSSFPVKISISQSQPLELIFFLSASDSVASTEQLEGLKALAERYPNVIDETFVIVRSEQKDATGLAAVLPLAATAQIYWDENGEADQFMGLPKVTPWGLLVFTGKGNLLYCWGTDVDNPVGIVERALDQYKQKSE